jgi:hypothetical protein
VALNCFSFWLERNSNWWGQYDAGDQQMRLRGRPRLSFWSLSWLMRWQDDYRARSEALRQAVIVSTVPDLGGALAGGVRYSVNRDTRWGVHLQRGVPSAIGVG